MTFKTKNVVRIRQNTQLVNFNVRIEYRNPWPLAYIFFHAVDIQHEYIRHIFPAFKQNGKSVFIRQIQSEHLWLVLILFAEIKALAECLIFI